MESVIITETRYLGQIQYMRLDPSFGEERKGQKPFATLWSFRLYMIYRTRTVHDKSCPEIQL